MHRKINCVLFDLDGTLIDSIPLIRESFRFTVKKVLGKELPDEVLLANVGRPLEEQMKIISPEKAKELVQVYREHNHRYHDQMVKPIEGIEELLRWLRQKNVKIGVVTSKSEWLAKRGLQVCKLDNYVDAVVAADHVEKPKPDCEPVEKCARMLDCRPEESVFIGDSPYDIEAGKKCGAITIGVPFGPFRKEVLQEKNPDYIVESVSDLMKLISELIKEDMA
jgi:pyrophosphatase PpaX